MKISNITRNCPDCNKLLEYSNKYECNRAEKKNKICYCCRTKKLLNDPIYLKKLQCGVDKFQKKYKNGLIKRKCSELTKNKIRKSTKILNGKNNPMYGKSINSIWLEKYGKKITYEKIRKLNEIRSTNSSGKNNPMYGKPSPQGSGNGWSGLYKGWFFRSLHELSYMINVIEKNNWSWESGEQKKYKIVYVDWEGKTRNYYPDFIVNKTEMIECKPLRLHNTPMILSKKQGAENFCKEKFLTYKLECPILLSTEEIKQLYCKKIIKFLPRYEEKYRKIYEN